MTITHLIYLLLLILAFLASLLARKHPPTLKVFPYLLGLSLLVELTVNIIHHGLGIDQGYLPLYHFYAVAEFTLLSYFFYIENKQKGVRRMIMILAIVYFVSLVPIYMVPLQTLTDFPGYTYNLMGLMIIIMSTVTLFLLEPIADLSILRHPVFWVCISMIIFYSSVVVFNGLYNFLREEYALQADILLQTIVKGANYILYLGLIRAFQCSHQMKK
ncbi:MAG: hypothetical protein AAGA85_14980 [Bacteroidota bacterium]